MKTITFHPEFPAPAGGENGTGGSDGGALMGIWRAWNRFWFSPADPLPLGVIRIFTGMVVLYIHLIYSLDLMSMVGPDGWMDWSATKALRYEAPYYHLPMNWTSTGSEEEIGVPIWSVFFHISDPGWIVTMHVTFLVVMFLFTIGFATRLTSVLTWFAVLCYIHRLPVFMYGMDSMMNVAVLYLMIGPSGATLSVDRLIAKWWARKRGLPPPVVKPSVPANFALRMMQIHFCFIYMASGLSKLKGPAWWNTNAYWDTLANPEFTMIYYRWYESLVREMVSSHVLYSVLAAAVVGFTFFCEIGLPFLVWTRLRPFIVVCGFFLHAGIAVFMGLWIFSLLMMTMLLGYLPGAAIRDRIFGTAADGRRLALRFLPSSDRQVRAAALARALDFDNRVDVVAATAGQPSVRVVADGREVTGPAAAAALFDNLGWLRPVRWVLRLPGLGGTVARWLSGEAAPGAAVKTPGKPQIPAAS